MRPNPEFPADLVTFTEEILNGKLYSLCSVIITARTTAILFCAEASKQKATKSITRHTGCHETCW